MQWHRHFGMFRAAAQMTTRPNGPVPFHARGAELAMLDDLVSSVSAGRGCSLLVHGEPGIGKSALVSHFVDSASGIQVLRCSGVEFEMALDFATLHQLCGPFVNLRNNLPVPQRRALESACGLADRGTSPPLLVGIALVALLSEATEKSPLVCVVEDVQWADRASLQALALVARRVADESVAFIFTTRDPNEVPALADLKRLPLTGLNESDSRILLAAVHPAPIDPEITNRVVLEARGNPLVLTEFPRSTLNPGLSNEAAGPQACSIEEGFVHRLGRLSQREQSFVTLAAAEPLGDPQLLAAAARTCGLSLEDGRGAEDDGMLRIDGHVQFRHPLVRSAAYQLATPAQRRAAHAALAEATDAERAPDRYAWHMASATLGRDELVAGYLEQSAARASARGGFSAAGTFLARAAQLSAALEDRTRRTLAAAQLFQQAGEVEEAVVLVDRLQPGHLDTVQANEIALLRARMLFQRTQAVSAVHEMLDLARHLGTDRARETYLEALSLGRYVDRSPDGPAKMARTIAAAVSVREPPRPTDLLLDALVAQATMAGAAAVEPMKRAVAAFVSCPEEEIDFRVMDHVVQLALDLLNLDSAIAVSDRQVRLAREHGALAVLARALKFRAIVWIASGRFGEASACGAEAAAIDEATGSATMPFSEVMLAAWQGSIERTEALTESIDPTRDGSVSKVATLYSTTVMYNGAGRYDQALEHGLRAFEQEQLGAYHAWMLAPELAEASSHAQQGEDEAVNALQIFMARAAASGTDYALAMSALSCALLERRPERIERLFNDAIDRLERTPARAHHGRALLLYGEWLRRIGRRVDARRALRGAYVMLDTAGADGFANRAALELQATGEHLNRRTDEEPREQLTAQEIHIAQQVAQGTTTKEVAAALFLSPRTVDAHLRNIFRKLGITSRRQLRGLL